MKKLISLLLVLSLAAMCIACGGTKKEGSEEKKEESPAYTASDFEGMYVCGRASAEITAEGDDQMSVFVSWSSSAAEVSEWTMSGTFDSKEQRFEYHDCIKTDFVYQESGDIESEEPVYENGHGFMFFKDADPKTMTWQEDQEDAAKDMVFERIDSEEEAAAADAGNPWQSADSLKAAAKGAGLDGFDIAEGSEISLGTVKVQEYRYMKGLAEAYIPFPAVDMTIRKGLASTAEDGDVSGDYNEYKNNWTQNIKGLEVTCFGNREGDATKTIWTVDDVCYSITAFGMGGDTDYGLSADDLNSLINGIQ